MRGRGTDESDPMIRVRSYLDAVIYKNAGRERVRSLFSLFSSPLLKVVASIESESAEVESLSVSVNQVIARTVGLAHTARDFDSFIITLLEIYK